MKFSAFKKPLIVTAVSAIAVSGALLTNTAFAAEGKKNLEAVYRSIKIVYNNQKVAMDAQLEPFLVNGTTYIPLRYAGEVFNKKIDWDPNTNTINVTDKESANGISREAQTIINEMNREITSLKSQLNNAKTEITEKEKDIAALQKQIETLNSQLAAANEVDLDDIEDELNDEYEDYKDTDGKITLKGDEKEITVTIRLDSNAWDALSTSSQESYLEDIVDDILKEADDAEITGIVRSKSDSSTLATFTVDDGDIEMEDFAELLEELEDELNDDYGDYENIDLTITLSGDVDEISIKVTVNESDWGDLSSSEKKSLYNDLLDDVQKEFEDADVEGDVYSSTGTRLASFN